MGTLKPYSESQARLNEQLKVIDELRNERTSLQRYLVESLEKITKLKNENNDLYERQAKSLTQENDLRTEIVELKSKITDQENWIGDLKVKVVDQVKATQEYKELYARADNNRSQFGAWHDVQVHNLNQKHNVQVNDLNQKVADLTQKADEYHETGLDLAGNVVRLEHALRDNHTVVTQLGSETKALRTQVADLTKKAEEYSKSSNAFQDGLDKSLASAMKRGDYFEARANKAEVDNQALQAQIDCSREQNNGHVRYLTALGGNHTCTQCRAQWFDQTLKAYDRIFCTTECSDAWYKEHQKEKERAGYLTMDDVVTNWKLRAERNGVTYFVNVPTGEHVTVNISVPAGGCGSGLPSVNHSIAWSTY